MNLAVLGRLKLLRYVVILTAGVYLTISVSGPANAAPYKSKQIRVEYVVPKDPAHQPIYERLKHVRALEHLQTLLSPLRLPRPLLLKVSGCDGEFERLVRWRLRDRLLRILGRPSEKCARGNAAERYYTRRCHTWTVYGRVLA